ncbi:MAG: FmdB family zinc ribbon protein [Thermodesulfobacteriota bacterium]
MPIYEYQCAKCGKIHEAWQKITDKPLQRCEACSGKLHKLISHSSFHLKGSGWYVTDYSGSAKPGASASPKAETESACCKATQKESKTKSES